MPDYSIPKHPGRGASSFHVTELAIPTIERPASKFDAAIKGLGIEGEVLNVIDWVWRNFPGFPEEGFLATVVEPFAGNPESIRANGQAWEEVGKQFGELVSNMAANATELAAEYWVGDAADAFSKFLKSHWKDGAAWAGGQLGKILRVAFDKAAEAADKIAEVVIRALGEIVRLAGKLAARAIPLYAAWSLIELVADALGIHVDSVYNDVKRIRELVDAIEKLGDTLNGIVMSLQRYLEAFNQLEGVVRAIPEIDSVAESRDTMNELAESRQTMKKQTEAVATSVESAGKSLDDVNKGIDNLNLPGK